jgi:uncharacterized phage protein (TIGR01671 family)
MKKEIKFRAWIKNDEAIGNIQNFMIYQNDQSLGTFFDHTIGDFNYELMQFIGLLDRLDKKIYEGDLLQVANNIIYEVIFMTQDEYDEIVCGFGLKRKDGTQFLIDNYAIKNGIVIGNIKENSEFFE